MAAIMGVDPCLFEAARIDGLNDFKIFFKVVLPISKSIIGVVAIFTMTAAYSDFLLPYLVLQDEACIQLWLLFIVFLLQQQSTLQKC